MIINILEAPILAALLSYIIKFYNVDIANEAGYTLLDNDNLPVYLFMSVIVSIFIGLTVSAEEIIKDRKILKRERFLNLSWSSYLMSKVAILFVLSAIQALLFVIIGNSILEIRGMYFEYWLVLFSAWVSSNLLGLVISDSFKTVVTIYILIPFLVIPQIILSGIIVKYEKLNPTISSPNSIPFYGEVILARWAYEALAVYQYTENKYQKQFFKYDEAMSNSDYKRNYWLKTLNNKIDICEKYLNNHDKEAQVNKATQVIRNEIRKEMFSVSGSKLKFANYKQLNKTKLSAPLIKDVKDYFETLRKYYIKLYNKASNEKDLLISNQQKTPQDREAFLNLKRNYFNESLSDLVRNSGEVDRIIEFNGTLIQKVDPIYLYPDSRLIRSHFYAPAKQFFGFFVNTFWINILVIWISTVLLYLILYYRLLKRALDFLEKFSGNTDSD
jgi:hypothetical protein